MSDTESQDKQLFDYDAKALFAVCDAMNRERDDLGQYINVFGYHPRHGVEGERMHKITYLPHRYFQGVGMVSEGYILPRKIHE